MTSVVLKQLINRFGGDLIKIYCCLFETSSDVIVSSLYCSKKAFKCRSVLNKIDCEDRCDKMARNSNLYNF